MKRIFIAFDIIPSPETRAAYEFIRHKLRQEKISWIADTNFHVTLKFLGDTGEESILPIISMLKKLLKYAPFRIALAGLGVFKSFNDPRVIWMGCRFDGSLTNIKKNIDSELVAFGYELENRAFSPHLTLGRIKHIRQTNLLSEFVALYKEKEFQAQLVKEIILYESQLTPSGSIYSPIHVFKLKSEH